MGVSEFVKRKLAMAYYRFDLDYDGIVAQGDFERLGMTVATLRGLKPGSSEADQIVEAHKGWWDAYFKGGDADGDGQVTLEEYLAFVDAWVGSDPDAIAHAIKGNELVFDTIDLDGDRKLTFEEFSLYLMAYGLAEDDAWTAFEHVDLDGDGLSRGPSSLGALASITSRRSVPRRASGSSAVTTGRPAERAAAGWRQAVHAPANKADLTTGPVPTTA